MLPNLYPLVDRAVSVHELQYEVPPHLQLSLKGGCDIGEALAVQGEVKEKPAPSGPMGNKRGRTGEQRYSLHSHTPTPHTHSSLSSS